MPKRNCDSNDESLPKPKKPKMPQITIDSDPTITSDYDKISALLAQKKTWRFPARGTRIDSREIANYFSNHNAESIKKRYTLCRRVLGETFYPQDVHPLL
jgi:hypothetical protein